MGFFDTFGKMINGQPLHGETSQPQTSTPASSKESNSHDPTRTSAGHKVHPEVRVTRIKSSRSGDRMQSYGWIQNNATFDIEVTKVHVMGRGMAMGLRLGPGQGREMKLYDGHVGTHDHDHAYVDFKISSNGDYFQQAFDVELDRQSDGAYLLEEFHPEGHVRDT